MKKDDLLLELGTEELPSKSLTLLSESLAKNISLGLEKATFAYESVDIFAAPRRLAVLIKQVEEQQQDRIIERRGPAVSAAYDSAGKPTKAADGFAKSCNVTLDQVTTLKTDKGEWLYYEQQQAGKTITALAPDIIKAAIKQLPIPKLMRWGNYDTQFIRPVHWVVFMFGNDVISTHILGQQTNNITYGHRFHHPKGLTLQHASEYANVLKNKGFVVASFAQRRQRIQEQIQDISTQQGIQTILTKDLLSEVTSIVEWPQALIGKLDERFLSLPKEVLISTLHEHQKCFHAEGKDHTIMPYFITVSNIDSKNPAQVISGNERVVHARLSDAEFFFIKDKQQPLDDRLDTLKTIVYQNKLGTMHDKSMRIAALAKEIASTLSSGNPEQAYHAGLLCKTDLASDMVGEFPDLQGIMGYYYALNEQQPNEVALAIKEHYQPRYSGDTLPESDLGAIIALADNIDTLSNIIMLKGKPKGDKDPYALRRTAFSIIRLIIEKKLAAIDLKHLMTNEDVLDFIEDRLRAYYKDQGFSIEVFLAVTTERLTNLCDLDHRIHAVEKFNKLPEADSLAEANKRVKNILTKNNVDAASTIIDSSLLHDAAEKELVSAISQINNNATQHYDDILKELASLKQPIDNFFEKVMVMDDDESIRNNRLAILSQLRKLFLRVADISHLSK